MYSILYDSFDFEYLINEDSLIFKTDNVNTFYGSTVDEKFVMFRVKRKYADMYVLLIREMTVRVNEETLLNRIQRFIDTVLKDYNFTDRKLAKVRFFKKQLYGRVQNIDNLYSVFANLDISFNWIDYISGVRMFDLPEQPEEFCTNMTYCMLARQPDGRFKKLLGTTITEDNFMWFFIIRKNSTMLYLVQSPYYKQFLSSGANK